MKYLKPSLQGRRNVSKVGGAISVSVDADPPPMLSGKMLGGLIHKFCRLSRIVGGAIAPPTILESRQNLWISPPNIFPDNMGGGSASTDTLIAPPTLETFRRPCKEGFKYFICQNFYDQDLYKSWKSV